MDRDLREKFEQLKDASVTIDLTTEIMEQIEGPRRRNRFLIPVILGLATTAVLGILLFPRMLADLERTTEGVQPIQVIRNYPQNFSLYPSPYLNIGPEQLAKGGKNSL